MNRLGFMMRYKKSNIEYYDIQYAAERTIRVENLETKFLQKELGAVLWNGPE